MVFNLSVNDPNWYIFKRMHYFLGVWVYVIPWLDSFPTDFTYSCFPEPGFLLSEEDYILLAQFKATSEDSGVVF